MFMFSGLPLEKQDTNLKDIIEQSSQSSVDFIDMTKRVPLLALRHNKPQNIVVHGTYSYPDFESLERHHKSRGFLGVGYHVFIDSNGTQYQARPWDKEGAHALGFNTRSISIGAYLTPTNMTVTQHVINTLREEYGNLPLLSHTQAQTMYLNDLLAQEGILVSLPTHSQITLPDVFTDLQATVTNLLSQHSITTPSVLNTMIERFKNCPQEGYTQLR